MRKKTLYILIAISIIVVASAIILYTYNEKIVEEDEDIYGTWKTDNPDFFKEIAFSENGQFYMVTKVSFYGNDFGRLGSETQYNRIYGTFTFNVFDMELNFYPFNRKINTEYFIKGDTLSFDCKYFNVNLIKESDTYENGIQRLDEIEPGYIVVNAFYDNGFIYQSEDSNYKIEASSEYEIETGTYIINGIFENNRIRITSYQRFSL